MLSAYGITCERFDCLPGSDLWHLRVLSNFVNGEYVAAAASQTSAVVDPSTGEEYARGAGLRPGRRRGRDCAPRRARSRCGGRPRLPSAAWRCCGWRTRRRRGPRKSSPRNAATPASPSGLTMAEEYPAPRGRTAVLRRRGAHPAGHLGRRVPGRAHLGAAPRADRGMRPGHALELPDDDGRVEVRPGDSRRGTRSCSSPPTPPR